jgi:hypothetical protein
MNGPEQDFFTGVMCVRDEWNSHPGLNGFVLPPDMPYGAARAIAKEEGRRNRQAEPCN